MQHQSNNRYLKDYKKLYQLYDNGTVFTSFDTETTGLSPASSKIIEIGAVKFNKDGIISQYNKLINPKTEIPYFITSLTHISTQMVKDCPPIENCLYEFLEFISDTVIVAHNAHFDMNFLNAECENAGFQITKNKVIDTLPFSRSVCPGLPKYKLDSLAEHFKINPGSSHRALDDAITCMGVFNNLIEISRNSKQNSIFE